MEIIHGRDIEYVPAKAKHRGGGLEFKYLAVGDEGTPENFVLELARQKEFYSPVHHHNFDQFRFAIKGDFSLKPNMTLKQGQLSYHPEGVYYGPQDDGPDERICLVLQFGGASGQGYIPIKTLAAASAALSEKGEFKGGIFYSNEGGNAVDGYQANWEHVKGQKLVYPAPRYHDPVFMLPENFMYKVYRGGEKAFRKLLGVFSERETRVEMLKIEKGGKLVVGSEDAIHLLYVLDGSGNVGKEMLTVESTIKLNAGASCEVVSTEGMEMLHFALPMLS